MLRFLTSGESHGKGLIGIIEGMPAGVEVREEYINKELSRRQKGHGRGGRMKIETDKVEIFSGVRNNKTLGSPISFIIRNKDYENWQDIMAPGECSQIAAKVVNRPRPGHADLPGAIKYNHTDMRNVLERASARETAARVAAGAIFKQLLEGFDIYIYSQVVSIGSIVAEPETVDKDSYNRICELTEASPVRCPVKENELQMIKEIDEAKERGESIGGSFETGAVGVVPGLGSHVSWDRRLDSRLAGLLMSIPAIKAVEVGDGIASSHSLGSAVHDQIYYNEQSGVYRRTNRAGGIEGGISNGETIWLRAYMKPIPTLYKPLTSVNTVLWCEEQADIERSDICAVPAAAVVGEAMLAYGISEAVIDKFGGDRWEQMYESYQNYRSYMKRVWKWKGI